MHWIGANSFSYRISAILTKSSAQGTGLLEPGEVGISKNILRIINRDQNDTERRGRRK